MSTPTEVSFQVVPYPNPSAYSFQLDVKTSSEEVINVKVYDMLGKLIESKTTAAEAINTMEIGANYPTGIYNVVVAQEDKTQTLRIIKR